MVYAPQSHRKSRPTAETLDGAVDLARDRKLVELCQTGDESAFAELYSRYCRRLHRFCLRRLHDSDDADEAVQEAFTRAWRALGSFGGERRFYPWLTVIAANVCTDMLRRRSRVVPMDDLPLRPIDLEPTEIDEQLLRQVDVDMASAALGHLSDRHRRVLHLREESGWSAQRIAEHEGMAVPAVDTLLWRARQAFRREFVALSDVGGQLAAVLGIGMVAVRRAWSRAAARAASVLPAPVGGPRALAASVVLAGAAVTGGAVALAGSGPHPASPAAAAASLPGAQLKTAGGPGDGLIASTSSPAGSSPSARSGSGGAASPVTSGAGSASPSRTGTGTNAAAASGSASPGTRGTVAAGVRSSLATIVTDPTSVAPVLSGSGLTTGSATASASTVLGAVTSVTTAALTKAQSALTSVQSTVTKAQSVLTTVPSTLTKL